MGELRGRAEGNVHIAAKHFADVRARDMHAFREFGLRKSHRLHLQKNLAEEGRDDMVDCFGLGGGLIVRLFDCSDCSITGSVDRDL